jgi:hypothetical protein
VKGLTLPQIFGRFNITRADLVKVDIEGAEVGLFMNAPDELLRGISQISMEFHDFCGLSTSEEIQQVSNRLRALGFEGFRFGIDNTNWLFARPNLRGVGALRRWYATQFVRTVRNGVHRARGLIGTQQVSPKDPPHN